MAGSYLDRILDDGTNTDRWLAARRGTIGASDAAKLAKAESVDKYLAAKLGDHTFTGNSYTESGHRWEPLMLAFAGIPQNTALFHAPDERGFTCTPDGILAYNSGRLRMAECKAKHGKVVTGPTLGEWRQLAWQFRCMPEADEIEFLWAEIVDGEMRGGEPKYLVIRRDDPRIVTQAELIEPIARDLLSRLTVALEYEKSLAA